MIDSRNNLTPAPLGMCTLCVFRASSKKACVECVCPHSESCISDEVQASSLERIEEERARHGITVASLEQAAADLEAKQAQIEGEMIQEQSSHRQRVAIISAPFDSLAASKAEIEQEQLQLKLAVQEAEARARVAFDSLPLLRLKVEETGHHKVHLVNEIAALLDTRSKMIQSLDDLFAQERSIDSDIAQVRVQCVPYIYSPPH